ncbi:hypothetical protein CQA70_29325, partial [Klebsiella pneumoniae]
PLLWGIFFAMGIGMSLPWLLIVAWPGLAQRLPLATPCTAPFLGTAVSVALVAPLPLLWGIFFAMGIGMSLPWLLIVAWPGLAQRLP